jgi:transposase InsO family protein
VPTFSIVKHFDYIKVFYNRVRRHSYLNYLSPVQFEQQQIGH